MTNPIPTDKQRAVATAFLKRQLMDLQLAEDERIRSEELAKLGQWKHPVQRQGETARRNFQENTVPDPHTLAEKSLAFGRGVADEMTIGTVDEIYGGLHGAIGGVQGLFGDEGFWKGLETGYDAGADQYRKWVEFDEENLPGYRAAGQVTAAVGTSLVPGVAPARLAGKAAQAVNQLARKSASVNDILRSGAKAVDTFADKTGQAVGSKLGDLARRPDLLGQATAKGIDIAKSAADLAKSPGFVGERIREIPGAIGQNAAYSIASGDPGARLDSLGHDIAWGMATTAGLPVAIRAGGEGLRRYAAPAAQNVADVLSRKKSLLPTVEFFEQHRGLAERKRNDAIAEFQGSMFPRPGLEKTIEDARIRHDGIERMVDNRRADQRKLFDQQEEALRTWLQAPADKFVPALFEADEEERRR